MGEQYFKYKGLLAPPVRRAAYSDRTAWLMAEMSRLSYVKAEVNPDELKGALAQADFELVQIFNCSGTQGFLAKRASDKLAVLVFRGTEREDPRDVITDLEATFYKDENGVKIHDGFYKAYKCVEEDIYRAAEKIKDYSLYVTGHSLGGALALIATRALNSDNLAACYTFGGPKVGNEEFGEEIKPPIYRIVNAFDIVPATPPTYLLDLLFLVPVKKVQDFISNFRGYDHHGDVRYLTPCNDNFEGLKVIENYNEFFRLVGLWTNRRDSIKYHDINAYCEKLAQWALKRVEIK